MEGRALVVQGLARATDALLASAESTEVLSRTGRGVSKELHHDAADGRATDGDIEEDAGVGHLVGSDDERAREVCERERQQAKTKPLVRKADGPSQ